jgi:hypothetical protein
LLFSISNVFLESKIVLHINKHWNFALQFHHKNQVHTPFIYSYPHIHYHMTSTCFYYFQGIIFTHFDCL